MSHHKYWVTNGQLLIFHINILRRRGGTFEYCHPLPHPPPIRAWIWFFGPADERWTELFAHFRSREIPYKNRCLICQFAMWPVTDWDHKTALAFAPTSGPRARNSQGEGLGEIWLSEGARRQSGSPAPRAPILLYVAVQSGLLRVKAKVPFPQFFSAMAEITPTSSLNLLWKYQQHQKQSLW